MKNSVTPQIIDHDTLVEILKTVQHGEFVNIESITPVKMNKGGNPYYQSVVKKSKKNVRTLPDYEKRVQKVTQNPEFRSKPSWFHHISPCVVEHNTNDNTYFMYETFENLHVDNEFTYNGEPISKEVLRPYLPEYRERDIDVFTISTLNIRKLSYKGQKYEVR